MKNKEIVEQVLSGILEQNLEKALPFMSDEIKMGWPGFFDLAPGKASVQEFFKDVPTIVSSSIGELIEEGNTVVGTGMVTSRSGDGTLRNSFFCDMYKLENQKVTEIKSYMVFEQSKQENQTS